MVSLKTPMQINQTVTKNRLFKSAMSEQLSDANHNPTTELINLYSAWSKGGIGLSVSGNIMVDRQQLGEPKNIVLDHQSDIEKFSKWCEAGKKNNTQFGAQLNHPGKQVPNFISKLPVAPSAIPLEGSLQKNFNIPKALTESEIFTIIEQFATSAKLAMNAGFTGIQIHGAHGYLVSQFLSSRHNQRTDSWGGSLENRMRFVIAVYQAIRIQVGNGFPVGIKLNSADFMKGGFTEDESLNVIQSLSAAGIDLIEISGGSYEATVMADGPTNTSTAKPSTLKREAFFLEFAEKAKSLVSTPIVVTGGFRSSQGMNQALQCKATDLIGLARPLAVDPNMPNKAMDNDQFSIELRTLTTGFKFLDKMVLLNMSWYEAQLERIGKGQDPNPDLNEWVSTYKVFKHLGNYAFRKRRA